MKMNNGIFIISLDFELYWGLRDKRTLIDYRENLLGVREAVEEILNIFNDYNIHATWATVGFLFFSNINELKKYYPAKLPTYNNAKLNPYQYIDNNDDLQNLYHFAPELLKLICKYNGQEIGTHTFSHYYCLENGQTIEQFKSDIYSAIIIARNKQLEIKSLVFPRNQWNEKYLFVLKELGIKCYRGNEINWLYSAVNEKNNHIFRRIPRLLDAYINISGYNTYSISEIVKKEPFNIPASRFLRPFSKKLILFENLRLKRIKEAMTYSAKTNTLFHLWWHPHNFGINTYQNISFLKKILQHFILLQRKYGMRSYNMGEISDLMSKIKDNKIF